MQPREIIKNIILKWNNEKNLFLVNKIDNCIREGFTGTEINGMIGRVLEEVKVMYPDSYEVAKDLIEEYLEYWRNVR